MRVYNGKNIGIFYVDDWKLIIENLAYINVGIFCVSKLEVFNDDSAQLMFAHYGDNLKGLALIYEINTNLAPISYDHKIKILTGSKNRIFEYLNGIYTDIEDFRLKSYKWEYEKEERLFGKPAIYSANEKGIELKGVLYTPRSSANVNMLKMRLVIYTTIILLLRR